VATRRRQNSRLLAGSLAAVALLLIAASWAVRHTSQQTAGVKVSIAATDHKTSPTIAGPASVANRATFVSNGDSIAVPIESASAEVTIVQVYPTTDTELRWRREFMLSSTFESNGG
jgi:hypothetical protein